MNRFCVYAHFKLTDPTRAFYIGKGTLVRAHSKHGRSNWWNSVTKKYGYIVEILSDNLIESEAFMLERDMIDLYRKMGHPLVNLTDGGEGNSGWKHTEEWKQQNGCRNKGKKYTEETRKKMSEWQIGRRMSIKAKENMRNAQLGRRMSNEYKIQQSDRMKLWWKNRKENINV
jgi:hypothetical protein